jgi:hypothetical protein
MALSSTDITKLASRKGVRKIAVENFLGTLGSEGPAGRSGALQNLYSDAASYKWNSATVSAITSGINKYFAAS